jgi:hypothetical protein
MIRFNGKHRLRVSNSTALMAALVLGLSTMVSLQGDDNLAVDSVGDHFPASINSAEEAGNTGESTTKSRKLNLKFLLFRHG